MREPHLPLDPRHASVVLRGSGRSGAGPANVRVMVLLAGDTPSGTSMTGGWDKDAVLPRSGACRHAARRHGSARVAEDADQAGRIDPETTLAHALQHDLVVR